MLTRETVTFRDSDGWSWEFDLTFMLSGYHCIWGRGCPDTQGKRTARGCCPDGVEVYDGDPSNAAGLLELDQLRERIAQMTDEDWQNRWLVLARGGEDPWAKQRFGPPGELHTRLYKGACVFHNREDHEPGSGCAFHVAAMRRSESPLDWKPSICWQVPLFCDIDEDARITTVRANQTLDWGSEDALHWWCMDHAEAFDSEIPVYVTMEEELRRVCGDEVYEELAAYCEARYGKPRVLNLLPMAS